MENKKISLLALASAQDDLEALKRIIRKIKDWQISFYLNTYDAIDSDSVIKQKPDIIFVYGLNYREKLQKKCVYDDTGKKIAPVIALLPNDIENPEIVSDMAIDGYIAEEELSLPMLHRTITNALAVHQLRQENAYLKDRLIQAEKSESIANMASGVAHELNNILCGVMSYPELLLLQLPSDSNFIEPIKKIRASGQRAADVVSDLLLAARGPAAIKQQCNLNSLVSQYLGSPEYMAIKSPLTNVTIKAEKAPTLTAITCSPLHIRKCLQNLLLNGMALSSQDGTIVITTGSEPVNEQQASTLGIQPGTYNTLAIKNNGPQIETEDLKRVFEPYYTQKKMGKNGATGIGLTATMSTMRDHGGIVTASSTEEETIFKLYFPAKEEADAPLEEESAILPDIALRGGGEKIVVIDDEPQQRDIAKRFLTSLNYSVTDIESGEKAIQYLKKEKADLLLLDMIMDPGLNGRRTYEHILEDTPNQKAIIVSAYSVNEEVEKAQKLGARQFIRKPYSRSQLALAVKKELRS